MSNTDEVRNIITIDELNTIIQSIMNNITYIDEQVLSMFKEAEKYLLFYNSVLLGISYLSFDELKSNLTRCEERYASCENIFLIILLAIWHDRLDLFQYIMKHYYGLSDYVYDNIKFLITIAEYRKAKDCLKYIHLQK